MQREQIYNIVSVDNPYFYGPPILYELCLLNSFWNVRYVTAVAPSFTFLSFSVSFFMLCLTLKSHTRDYSIFWRKLSKQSELHVALHKQWAFLPSHLLSGLFFYMPESTYDINHFDYQQIPSLYILLWLRFSADLIMMAPTTWPMEWSSKNFFIEKWLLVSRPQGLMVSYARCCSANL